MILLVTSSSRISKVLALPLLLAVTQVSAQDVPGTQASAKAVARASFDALKRRDIPAFVSLFHPAEYERIKMFALDVFRYNDSDAEIRGIRELFVPYDSTKSIASASGSDLLATFLKNSFSAIPGFDKRIGDAELHILGEIEEKSDRVHVITRTVAPRPSPVSCLKSDGRWYQLLNVETMRMITEFKRKRHFRKKNASAEKVLKSMTMDRIEVIGFVKDGEDLAQILCRVTVKMDDFNFPILGCYPVRKGEPAWDHLSDNDKTELIKDLRAKWSR